MVFPDALRAVASLAVVLPHAIGFFAITSLLHPAPRAVIATSLLGLNGVQIFFVLSGFVIALTLDQQLITPRYMAVFILRRSVRLDPPYWCAIAISLGYIALRMHISPGHAHMPSVNTFVAHLFYLQELLHLEEINVVFWTLCLEVQFYIAFCSLLGLAQQLRKGIKVPIEYLLFTTYLLSLLWPLHILPAIHGFFGEWWFAFMAGVLVCWACVGHLRYSTAALMLSPLLPVAIATRSLPVAATAATAYALLWCSYKRGLYRWLGYPRLQSMGRLSYCLYLVHVPVVGVLLALFTHFHPTSAIAGYAGLILTYALSIPLAWLLHRAVEVPCLRWSQRLKSLQGARSKKAVAVT
jgi:peptidoglycan/LPS O-acetylase OafA/YrhL